MLLLSVLQVIYKVFKTITCNFVKKLRFSKAKSLQASCKTETDSHPPRDRELQENRYVYPFYNLTVIQWKQSKWNSLVQILISYGNDPIS